MSIEDVKNWWDARPCNVRHSSAPLGSKEYFDEVEARKHFVEPHILPFANFAAWRDKDVLEIGCGIGTATVCFARAGARVVAVDLSEVSMELCRRRLAIYGLEAETYVGNAEELDTFLSAGRKFDLIYSFGVIHHSPNPRKIVEQMSKFIRLPTDYNSLDGGEIRIMLYSLVSYKVFDVMRETNQWDMAKIRQTIQRYSEAQEGSPCSRVYSFSEARELLEPWFDIYSIKKAHIFTWDVDEYKKGKYVKAAAWRDVDDVELAQLEHNLGWHTLIKARPDLYAIDPPPIQPYTARFMRFE